MVYEKLFDFDKAFEETERKIVINDLSLEISGRETLKESLSTVYESDVIDMRPKCYCETTIGYYNMGKTCPECSSKVRDPLESNGLNIWISRVPETPKFLNIVIWEQLSKALDKRNFRPIRWLVDKKYNPNIQIPEYLTFLKDHIKGFERNYEFFANNLELIILTILQHPIMAKSVSYNMKKSLTDTLKLIKEYKDKIFSEHIPLLGKDLFVQEVTNKGSWTHLISGEVHETAVTVLELVNGEFTKEKKVLEVGRLLDNLASSTAEGILKQYLTGKTKLFRKNILGWKGTFNARGVISPPKGLHRYDQLIIPWGVALTLLRPDILNRLFKMGYSYIESTRLINDSYGTFNQLLNDIMEKLISESFDKRGLPCIFQRNPSMLQGSALLFFIPGFHKDPNIMSFHFPILPAKWPNADFDGDEMNLTLLTDKKMYELFKNFYIPNNLADIEEVGGISGHLTITKPVTSSIAAYIKSKRKEAGLV